MAYLGGSVVLICFAGICTQITRSKCGRHRRNDVYLLCASEPLNSKYKFMLIFSAYIVH